MEAMFDNFNYVICFFLVYIFSIFLLHYFLRSKHIHLPPSPPALPIIGHLHYLSLPMHKCLQELSSRHGPLLYLWFGLRPFLIVSSASTASEIFKKNDQCLAYRPTSPFGGGVLLGNYGFIMAPYGDYWRLMKKCSVTELHGARKLVSSQNVRREEIVSFLRKVLDKAHKNEVVDVGKEVARLVNKTMSRMIMSARLENGEAEICGMLMNKTLKPAERLAFTLSLGPLERLGVWAFQRQMLSVNRSYDKLLDKILREHEDKIEGADKEMEDKDLTDLLLEICNDEHAEVKINRRHIKAFLLDLFLAGTNTLTGTTQWIMAYLLNHPEVFNKLREEIESVTGKNRLADEADASKLHYLQAVVKESIRLHPPFPLIPRASVEDCRIRGFDVPKDTTAAINAYAIMRDPEIWDDPEEFRPESFLAPQKKEQNFHFVAFGGGRRMCPGAALALNVVFSSIATMVQCFDWKVGGVGDNGGVKVNR